MSTNQAYIISLCQTLSNKGHTPTVALLRSKATRKLNIPEVIAGLRAWRAQPMQSVTEEIAEPDTPASASLEQRVQKLEQQVAALERLINKQMPQ